METLSTGKKMTPDLSTDDLGKENTNEYFYNPLSITGYLTPLQRKKLRELRGIHSQFYLESNETQKVIKPRMIKRKRDFNANVSSKDRKQIKKLKAKECISQIQCSAAQIICRKNDNFKDKKFFKASSPNRLQKANFSMPFVFKKNLFAKTNNNVKCNNVMYPDKNYVLKQHSYNSQPSHCAIDEKDSSSLPLLENNNKNFSCKTECSLQRKLPEIKMTEDLMYVTEKVFDFDFDWPSDESLLKRQQEARANIKKQKILKESALNLKVDDIKEKQNDDKPAKFYPIFYAASRKRSKSQQEIKKKQNNGLKKLKELMNGEQMIIDAGQKEIGPKICSTCNMLYSIGIKGEEEIHSNYCSMYLGNLKFLGWKEENVIGEYPDGRIIMVRKTQQNNIKELKKIEKIKDVLEIANRDLGFSTLALPNKPDLTFVLFISNAKQVAGCVVAEPISQASRVLLAKNESSSADQKDSTWRIGNWYSSSETVPAICGINRIWVAHNYRRQKIASRMIDCLRCHFIYGHVIGIRELAFTDPSPDGREFAASYTKTDNFLVYR